MTWVGISLRKIEVEMARRRRVFFQKWDHFCTFCLIFALARLRRANFLLFPLFFALARLRRAIFPYFFALARLRRAQFTL